MLGRVDHVALAVADLDAAIDHYRRAWGMEPEHRETVPDQGVEEAMLRVGDTHVQLVAPLTPDSPVGRFLERRGEGMHHVAYRVDDLDAALARLREAGVALVDEAPRPGSRGTRIAFVHPGGNLGVLVELVERR